MSVLDKKIGKFKAWQLAAIGGGAGLLIYVLHKSSGGNSETGEGLVASTNNPINGENGLGGLGGGSPEQIPGAPGEPGAPGAPGVEQFSPKEVEQLDEFLSQKNNPPAVKKAPTPIASRFTRTNPNTGQKFRTEHKNGKIVHVYQNGKRVIVGAGKRIAHPNPHQKRTHAGGGGVRAISHARPKPKTHPKATAKKPAAKPKAKARR